MVSSEHWCPGDYCLQGGSDIDSNFIWWHDRLLPKSPTCIGKLCKQLYCWIFQREHWWQLFLIHSQQKASGKTILVDSRECVSYLNGVIDQWVLSCQVKRSHCMQWLLSIRVHLSPGSSCGLRLCKCASTFLIFAGNGIRGHLGVVWSVYTRDTLSRSAFYPFAAFASTHQNHSWSS